MKKLLAAVMLVALAGCEPAPRAGSDGYTFGDKQYTQNTVQVEIVTYASREDLEREIKRRGIKGDGNQIIAFTSLYPKDPSRCTIHMVDPAVEYVPEFVGHEFLHCVYGQWHSSNQQRG